MLELGASLFAEFSEEAEQRFYPAFRAAPEKAPGTGIELIDHGQILLALEDSNLINTDYRNTIKISIGQT
jgi:hypothetical protein